MREHQFIHKNEQSKNRRICFLLLLLFFACYMGLGLTQMHLTSQMRCSNFCESVNSPLRTSRIHAGIITILKKDSLLEPFFSLYFIL